MNIHELAGFHKLLFCPGLLTTIVEILYSYTSEEIIFD